MHRGKMQQYDYLKYSKIEKLWLNKNSDANQ